MDTGEVVDTQVDVREFFLEWTPPFDVKATVSRMLGAVPSRYLVGLRTVVLTNTHALSPRRKKGKIPSHKRRIRADECNGLYHHAFRGDPPWIEIFVDNIFRNAPSFVVRLALFREILLAKTLYHELGHHVHATQAPEH